MAPIIPGDRLDASESRFFSRQLEPISSTVYSKLYPENRGRSLVPLITDCAGGGEGNLLALAIACAQARASLGEISDAMEVHFGRYTAVIRSISADVTLVCSAAVTASMTRCSLWPSRPAV